MNTRKATCVVLVVVYLLMLFGMGALEIGYSCNLPGSPQVDTGHVYRMTVNHGFVVYGTKLEREVLDTERALFPLMIATAATLFMLRPWSQNQPLPEPRWLVIVLTVLILLLGVAGAIFGTYK